MRIACIALVVFGLSVVASAQLSPEEAYQKLQEKQKERAAAAAKAGAATQPAADAPAGPARPVHGAGMAEGQLLHQGWEQVAAHRYAQAMALFDRAASIDSVDPNALMGRGICKYELKQYKAAAKDTERAYGLASAGGPAHVSRQLVIAACAADVMNDNPMRAVKMLRGLMEPMEQDNHLDEELQNDLGIALAHTDAQAKKSPLYAESMKYYQDYDKKLNDQKDDGTARWGPKWLPKDEAEEKWKKYQTASENAQEATVILDHTVAARQIAHMHYVDLHGLALHGTEEIARINREYKQALKDEAAAQDQWQRAMNKFEKVEKPPFPDRIECEWQEPR